jgi:KipI family sensor histidine kinase inhibitor
MEQAPPPEHQVQFRISGDRALLAVYGEGVDPAVNEKVRRMAALVKSFHHPGIEAVVPSYCTLALHYNPLHIRWSDLADLLLDLEQRLDEIADHEAATVDIPVCYGGELGPDLAFVAAQNEISPDEVIRIHSAVSYRIYAIGFAPGFCYLGGLDPRIHTPRLTTPRLQVAAGSVGIAGSQTGVYPLASPGGWQLIGRTPLCLFAPDRSPPIPYQSGDTLRFRPVSFEEFEHLQQGAAP